MDILCLLRDNLNISSPFVGKALALIPYRYRPGIGKIYRQRRKEIAAFETFTTSQKKQFIYSRFFDIVNYAYHKVPFYKQYYDREKFRLSDLKGFDDISRVPVVNKLMLREYSLNERSSKEKNRYYVATSGSTGEPFFLYISSDLMGHEWSHMHYIWAKLGYRSSDLKLVFSGRNTLGNSKVKYDALRHSYAVDLYQESHIVAERLKQILSRQKISYLHGYPSAIYEFSLFCRDHDTALRDILSQQLKGVLLGSEYPMPIYRSTIEETFGIPSVSWYGHTERCILAYEKHEQFVYHPFQTYGYAEALETEHNDVWQLIGTSYYNRASPLIRYDTGDEVNGIRTRDGILEDFSIQRGRTGQFLIDKHNRKLPISGVVPSRCLRMMHHCRHLQLAQEKPGEIVILYVPINKESMPDPVTLFDASGVALDVSFKRIDAPVKTPAGKINLLVPFDHTMKTLEGTKI
jgi:phenylacetate-CoA ligase